LTRNGLPRKVFPGYVSCEKKQNILYTMKGKGLSFMENAPEWHARWPNPDEEAKALEELK
jgi:hypothetical protein